MSLRRYAAKKDGNATAIRDALRAAGCTVRDLNEDGLPDFLCGLGGVTFLVEAKKTEPLKRPRPGQTRTKARFTEAQEEFMRTWRGSPVWVVESVEGVPVVLSRVTSEGQGQVR